MVEHTTSVQVRWSDVDPAGIVYYPRFFQWYDLGCETLFLALGLPWPETFPKYGIVGVPIVESGSKFTSPARYGDVLTIRSRVAWVTERSRGGRAKAPGGLRARDPFGVATKIG